MSGERDRWAEWLLSRRHGDDAAVFERRLPNLHRFRDRVLDNAAIEPGDVILDIGAGDGLIGFGALERTGAPGRVIFSDISEDLLAECRRIAAGMGVEAQCEFVRASADDLHPIPNESVDVATTRSVLIYLDDKRPAFGELFRVLKPSGRLSIFEPINRFGWPEADHVFYGFDVRPVQHLAAKLKARYRQPDAHPLTNFDERDLFRCAEEAGFQQVRLEYTAELKAWTLDTTDWDVLLKMSGNPLDPTLGEELADALTPAEQTEFEAYLRPLVERGERRVGRSAEAFLTAVKPSLEDAS
jgi:ubiquinone/menaquinone biosynthesis C-methylase UbiE